MVQLEIPNLESVSCNALEISLVFHFPWSSAAGPSNAFVLGLFYGFLVYQGGGGRYLSRITPIFLKLSHITEKQNIYYLTQYKYLKQNIYYLTKSGVEEREKWAQHDWPIEQCLLHIRVFFGTKTKSPCFDLFIHWVIKLTNN